MEQPKIIDDKTTNYRFYHIDSKRLYPSVTTVLNYDKKEQLKGWIERVGEEEAARVSKSSSGKGTQIHSLIYEYLMNKDEKIKEMYPILFELLKPRLDVMKPIYMETPLWSDTLKIAGTTDFIGEFNGVPHIIDFKTFKVDGGEYDFSILETYYLQATAYSVMAFERFGMKIQHMKIMKICPWKYSEAVFDFDVTFNKQLLSKLVAKIKDFYKHCVVFPQITIP